MKVKPKEILVNLPTVIMFADYHEIAPFASNINQLIHGKVKVKYEELGQLAGQYVGLFYLQRNDEFEELRTTFKQMIEREEIATYSQSKAQDSLLNRPDPKNCKHNWVLDGHNCGEPICSECFARE